MLVGAGEAVLICLQNGQLGNPRKHRATEPFIEELTPHTGIKSAERDSAARVFSATLVFTKGIFEGLGTAAPTFAPSSVRVRWSQLTKVPIEGASASPVGMRAPVSPALLPSEL